MAQLPRPAAALEDPAAWADALDVDDSDLRHNPMSSLLLLRPCTTSHPRSSHRRIPGPASAVQDAMRLPSPLTSAPTARADGQAADSDFLLEPWLRALRDLGDDRAWRKPGIGMIRGERALDRARLVVGMVTLCTPNGFGDLVLNLKDPSGTIDASVHKKVLSEGNLCKGLSVGSVIVLKQVAVLRPSRTTCYLNVTQKNVEKVFQKDSDSPCKQVISSSNTGSQQPAAKCTETRRFAHLGDNMERRARAEISEGASAILSKISRTKGSQTVKVLSDNSGAANAVQSSILRTEKGTFHGVENHHEIRLEEMDLSPARKNVPSYNTSQQLQKIINSMNPANCELKRGSSPKHGRSSEAESSTDNIMRRLLGGETMTPCSKDITVAEVSHYNRGAPCASNSTSRMNVAARCSSEKHKEIGIQKMVEGLCSKTDEHQQQNTSANKRCSQPILGGSSVISGSRDCSQACSTENLWGLSDDELMQPSRKKLKSDALLSDGNGARTNSNISTLSMDTETKYCLENNLNIGLDDIAEGFHGEDTSIRKVEHQHKDFRAANVATLQPTQVNCSISATNATAIGGTFLSNTKKLVSVASVAEWTDDQLSELFADY